MGYSFRLAHFFGTLRGARADCVSRHAFGTAQLCVASHFRPGLRCSQTIALATPPRSSNLPNEPAPIRAHCSFSVSCFLNS